MASIRDMWRAGWTRRYHTEMVLRDQDVAQHSFGVALICAFMHPNPSARLLKAALQHDLHEKVSGDTPFPVKSTAEGAHAAGILERIGMHSMNLEIIELTEHERTWLKAADMLDAVWYCELEMELGNCVLASDAFPRIVKWWGRTEVPTPLSIHFTNAIAHANSKGFC